MTDPRADDRLVARLRTAGCVFAEHEAAALRAAAADPDTLERMTLARVAGSPLEHVLGEVDFAGLRVALGPGSFVPRARSEYLVRCALESVEPGGAVLDLCCGVGAVGLAVARRVDVDLHLADIDPVALGWARANAESSGRTAVSVHEGDLFAALPASAPRFAVITVVAPYVPTAELEFLPAEAREHEPRPALDGGVDGLDVIRHVMADAPTWLVPGGRILVEVGRPQVERTLQMVGSAGLDASVQLGHDGETVVCGVRAPGPQANAAARARPFDSSRRSSPLTP